MTEHRLTGREAADHLNISVRQVYNLNTADNDFPKPVYVGRTPMWDPAELDAWRAEHPARERAPKPKETPAPATEGRRKKALTDRQARTVVDGTTLTKAPDWAETHAWHAVTDDGTVIVVVLPSYGGASASGRNGWTYYLAEFGPGGQPGPYKTRESAMVQGLLAWTRWVTTVR
jgi:predicted DNA-binding transcriptional regulator AlpA